MTSVRIMEFIPELSKAQAQWCVKAVYSITKAGGGIKEQEKDILQNFAGHFGVSCPKELDNDLGNPPAISVKETQYVKSISSWRIDLGRLR